MMNLKKAQEEIVGFSIIIVIVAVIIIIFLSLSIQSNPKTPVESYEVDSFLQSLIQKTTDCIRTDNFGYYSMKDLMFKCYYSSKGVKENCYDKRDTCDALLREVGGISNKSWNHGVEKDFPVKGYLLNIKVDGEEFKKIGYGNQTKSTKGSFQQFSKEGREFVLEFNVYY